MRGKAPVEGGAALGEYLEEHAEGAPSPVDLALDHGHRQQRGPPAPRHAMPASSPRRPWTAP